MFLDEIIKSNIINKLPFFGVTCGKILDHQEKRCTRAHYNYAIEHVNRSNSANYRAIALGSLFCKMFDSIILNKHYDNLMSDELQIRYKKGTSTV